MLLEVPDYNWQYGCFGTATGNLMGYWDRHGFPDFYTGPTAGGLAPLNNDIIQGNEGIRSMWASQAGFDGRPAGQYGHRDDYWIGYESTGLDPYLTYGRPEHSPDCIGDFIGLNQLRWTNMNGECDGNIDGYSFVYWDATGNRRVNFIPSAAAGTPARDIPSGLREWTRYRGYDADVFTQLTDFNTTKPPGSGFTFQDLKAEIDSGYPVLLFLQQFNQYSSPRGSISRGNPPIHGMLAYGYEDYPAYGIRNVHYRTSWGYPHYSAWSANPWEVGMPVRGVICYHPKPKIRSVRRAGGNIILNWDGPSSQLYDELSGATTFVHRYQVERSLTLQTPQWQPVGSVTTNRAMMDSPPAGQSVFYRIRLLRPDEIP